MDGSFGVPIQSVTTGHVGQIGMPVALSSAAVEGIARVGAWLHSGATIETLGSSRMGVLSRSLLWLRAAEIVTDDEIEAAWSAVDAKSALVTLAEKGRDRLAARWCGTEGPKRYTISFNEDCLNLEQDWAVYPYTVPIFSPDFPDCELLRALVYQAALRCGERCFTHLVADVVGDSGLYYETLEWLRDNDWIIPEQIPKECEDFIYCSNGELHALVGMKRSIARAGALPVIPESAAEALAMHADLPEALRKHPCALWAAEVWRALEAVGDRPCLRMAQDVDESYESHALWEGGCLILGDDDFVVIEALWDGYANDGGTFAVQLDHDLMRAKETVAGLDDLNTFASLMSRLGGVSK